MQETWVRSLGWEDCLEKGMATHSSTFAWEIPWTEEPHGLESTGSQKGQTRLGNYSNDDNKITKHIKPRHTNSKFIDKFKIWKTSQWDNTECTKRLYTMVSSSLWPHVSRRIYMSNDFARKHRYCYENVCQDILFEVSGIRYWNLL